MGACQFKRIYIYIDRCTRQKYYYLFNSKTLYRLSVYVGLCILQAYSYASVSKR